MSFYCLLVMFFFNPFRCLSLSESLFFVVTFRGLYGSSIEFISFRSLFTFSLHFIFYVHYTHGLYQRGAYL